MYFFLDKKVPKNQDYACFAQKTYAQKAKTPKLASPLARLKQWVFFNAFLTCFLAHQSRSILGILIIHQQFNIYLHALSAPPSEGSGEAPLRIHSLKHLS